MDKAWSNSLTALVRQLYHSSKASVKQYPPRALHDGILGFGRRLEVRSEDSRELSRRLLTIQQANVLSGGGLRERLQEGVDIGQFPV